MRVANNDTKILEVPWNKLEVRVGATSSHAKRKGKSAREGY